MKKGLQTEICNPFSRRRDAAAETRVFYFAGYGVGGTRTTQNRDNRGTGGGRGGTGAAAAFGSVIAFI